MFTAIRLLALIQLLFGASAVQEVSLRSPEEGYRVTNPYETSRWRVELTLNYRRPGTILDTVGINAAPVGSFVLALDEEGVLSFSVYDPGRGGPLRDVNGWHRLVHPTPLPKDQTGRVVLQVSGGKIWLRLDERTVSADCVTPLSGQPVFLGDFKGDEGWGAQYQIHRGIVGTVGMVYWGEPRSSTDAPSGSAQASPSQTAPGPAKPTQAPTGSASAGASPTASAAVGILIDETGQMSPEQLRHTDILIGQAQAKLGIQIALIYCVEGLPTEAMKARAEQYFIELKAARRLSEVSGVLVLAPGQYSYQRDTRLDLKLPPERPGEVWLSVSRKAPDEALRQFLVILAGLPSPGNPGGGASQVPAPASPHPPAQAPTQAAPAAPETGGTVGSPAALTQAAAALEEALQAGDSARLEALVLPELWADLRQFFAADPAAMRRLAQRLATRQFVASAGVLAEFSVQDDGRRVPLTFQSVQGRWLLAGL